MKRNFTHPIKNMNGEQISDAGTPVTLATVALNALLAAVPNDTATGEVKVKRYALALKINATPADVEVTAEELALLKTQIGVLYAPLVVGRAFDLLEEKGRAVMRVLLLVAVLLLALPACIGVVGKCEREVTVKTMCESGGWAWP